jgi:hypothetical protein
LSEAPRSSPIVMANGIMQGQNEIARANADTSGAQRRAASDDGRPRRPVAN